MHQNKCTNKKLFSKSLHNLGLWERHFIPELSLYRLVPQALHLVQVDSHRIFMWFAVNLLRWKQRIGNVEVCNSLRFESNANMLPPSSSRTMCVCA
eukprot:4017966-Amphidinium_carterae.1